ncbi:MAG: TniB family NTP-binding protein [Ktedonobacterales bacterium]
MKMTLVKEPLTIPETVLRTFGVATIRAHLAPQFTSLTKRERLLWLNAFTFLLTHDLRQLDQKIANVLAFHSAGQTRNFLIGGESGMGKTSYLDWLRFNHLPKVETDRNIIPIIGVQAPIGPQSARPLLWRLLLACSKTYLLRDNEEMLLMKLVLYLHQCRVELIIIDEIQQITRPELKRRVLEISNLAQDIPIICASCSPIGWTAGDREIQGRWNDFFQLKQYTGARLDALLATIELFLPFSTDSHLSERTTESNPGLAELIEKWTGGILRDIMILIRDGCRRAIEQSSPCLTPELLSATWKDIQTEKVTDFLDLIRARED